MDVHKKVVAFIYWAHDIQQSQEIIIYTFWTQKQIMLSVQELDVETICAKSDMVEIKMVNINIVRG